MLTCSLIGQAHRNFLSHYPISLMPEVGTVRGDSCSMFSASSTLLQYDKNSRQKSKAVATNVSNE